MTNIDKGKVLLGLRKRLGLKQKEMAKKLGLHVSYLSQLEKGRRTLDPFYLEQAERMVAEFEKSKIVKVPHGTGGSATVRGQCEEHMDHFLDTCEEDVNRLGWTLIELQTVFPLNKWGRGQEAGGPGPSEIGEGDQKRVISGGRSRLDELNHHKPAKDEP